MPMVVVEICCWCLMVMLMFMMVTQGYDGYGGDKMLMLVMPVSLETNPVSCWWFPWHGLDMLVTMSIEQYHHHHTLHNDYD